MLCLLLSQIVPYSSIKGPFFTAMPPSLPLKMSPSAVLALVLVSLTAAQFNFRPQQPPSNANALTCGFSCTRQASFTVMIDGVSTTARCTDANADPTTRCSGCCQSRALAAGLPTTSASGFPSTNGVDCVCCFNNDQCRGGF